MADDTGNPSAKNFIASFARTRTEILVTLVFEDGYAKVDIRKWAFNKPNSPAEWTPEGVAFSFNELDALVEAIAEARDLAVELDSFEP